MHVYWLPASAQDDILSVQEPFFVFFLLISSLLFIFFSTLCSSLFHELKIFLFNNTSNEQEHTADRSIDRNEIHFFNEMMINDN